MPKLPSYKTLLELRLKVLGEIKQTGSGESLASDELQLECNCINAITLNELLAYIDVLIAAVLKFDRAKTKRYTKEESSVRMLNQRLEQEVKDIKNTAPISTTSTTGLNKS